MKAIRSAAFLFYLVAATFVLLVPATFVRLLSDPARRQTRALGWAQRWARTIVWGARALCGVTCRLEGAEHVPDGPALIAARHESAFDAFIWLLVLPRCTYVVKQELARIPLLGKVIRAAGMIAVDRGAGAPALRRMAADVETALAAGFQVVIFPEGTRVAPDAPVVLQPGIALLAARLDVPIHPAATDSGRLWTRRTFDKRPGTIRLALRPALPRGLPRAALMAALAAGMRLDPVDKSVG